MRVTGQNPRDRDLPSSIVMLRALASDATIEPATRARLLRKIGTALPHWLDSAPGAVLNGSPARVFVLDQINAFVRSADSADLKVFSEAYGSSYGKVIEPARQANDLGLKIDQAVLTSVIGGGALALIPKQMARTITPWLASIGKSEAGLTVLRHARSGDYYAMAEDGGLLLLGNTALRGMIPTAVMPLPGAPGTTLRRPTNGADNPTAQ